MPKGLPSLIVTPLTWRPSTPLKSITAKAPPAPPEESARPRTFPLYWSRPVARVVQTPPETRMSRSGCGPMLTGPFSPATTCSLRTMQVLVEGFRRISASGSASRRRPDFSTSGASR